MHEKKIATVSGVGLFNVTSAVYLGVIRRLHLLEYVLQKGT